MTDHRTWTKREIEDFLEREDSHYQRVRGDYEQWIAYCKSNGWTMKYVDVTTEIKLISED
jgi:hypothetical protein